MAIFSHKHGKAHGAHAAQPRFAVALDLELPPVVLFGPSRESSGCMLSGVLNLEVGVTPATTPALSPVLLRTSLRPSRSHAETPPAAVPPGPVTIAKVSLTFFQAVLYAKPFVAPSLSLSLCTDCRASTSELARWDVLTEPHTFSPGTHGYPFLYLVPGLLPPTATIGSVGTSGIAYKLRAVATTATGHEVVCEMPVRISRLLLPGPDRTLLRVFPPTPVTITAVLPHVVHPRLTFPVEFRLDHLVDGNRRWRMRKLNWRIEENSKVCARACAAHREKLLLVTSFQRKQQGDSAKSKASQSTGTIGGVVTGMSVLGALIPLTQEILPAESGNADNVGQEQPPGRHPADHGDLPAASPTVKPKQEYLYLEETRTLAHGELHLGWKSDFSEEGKIELALDIDATKLTSGAEPHVAHALLSVPPPSPSRARANMACDVDDDNRGIQVGHMLFVEAVVCEEIVDSLAPVALNTLKRSGSPKGVTPTGVARVLRMQFKLFFAERSGLGILWDDEVPPTYEAVKLLSPPVYAASPYASPPYASVVVGHGDTPGITPLATPRGSSTGLDERIDGLQI